MKPYFETKLGRLWHGDCVEGMQHIGPVDLIITDPPYGMKYKSGHYKYGNPHDRITGDDRFPAEIIPKFKEMARKAVFCFCRWNNLHDVEIPKSFIVWAKNNWSAGDLKRAFGRQWEGILFYPGDEHKFNTRLSDFVQISRVPPTQISHPTQKPTALIDWLLRGCSEEGDVIFDPFMGSGTTAVSAENLNRRWIGIEISEKYCEIAAKRIEMETRQMSIFDVV